MPQLVAVGLPAGVAFAAALAQAWDAGDAVLPLDPDEDPATTAALLARLRPHRVRDAVGERARPGGVGVPDGTALVVTTSGSTGQRRGVVLSHDALRTSVAASRERLGARDGEPWLGVLPTHHVAGVAVLLRAWASDAPVTLHPRDTPQVVAAAPPSWISLVPTQLRRLLDARTDLSRHLGVLLGGAPVPARLLDRAAAAGVAVTTSYGMTETCGGCVYDGVPLAGVQVALDQGRVLLRGPVLATGLRGEDGPAHEPTPTPLTDEDGWLRTADAGRLDDGRLVVTGRLDRVVISGGENVALAEIETHLRAHPGVADAAAVGLDDPTWGTRVGAVVAARDPAAPPSVAELESWSRELPAPARPRDLRVVAVLPTSGLDKPDPAAVRALLGDARGGAGAATPTQP